MDVLILKLQTMITILGKDTLKIPRFPNIPKV